MIATIETKLNDRRVDKLVDSWFTQRPAVSSEDIDALEIQPAEQSSEAPAEFTEEHSS